MEKVYLLDMCGVHNLHGMPRLFSGLISAIAAAIVSETASQNMFSMAIGRYLA